MPNDPKVSARLKEWDASDLSQNIQEHHRCCSAIEDKVALLCITIGDFGQCRKIDGVLSCYTHIAKRINADQPKEDVVALSSFCFSSLSTLTNLFEF